LGDLDIATRRKHCHSIAINIQEDTNDAEVDMGDCAVLGMSFGESVVLDSWLIYTNSYVRVCVCSFWLATVDRFRLIHVF